MTIFQVIAALLMPVLAQRGIDRRPLLGISLLAQTVGYLGLLLAPLQFPHLWVALCGFGLGACFALSLLLTLDHHRDPRQAGQLAAFVQGVGFLINAISPWMTGWLRETHRQLCQRLGGADGDRRGDAGGDAGVQPGHLPHGSRSIDMRLSLDKPNMLH